MQLPFSYYVQAPGFIISWEIQDFGGSKEERSSSPRFLSLSQITLVKARVERTWPQIAGQHLT